jgi:hypothetical protein
MSHSPSKTYYAVEFGPIEPTTNFNRAVAAAGREADKRKAAVTLYENGREALIFHPAQQVAR